MAWALRLCISNGSSRASTGFRPAMCFGSKARAWGSSWFAPSPASTVEMWSPNRRERAVGQPSGCSFPGRSPAKEQDRVGAHILVVEDEAHLAQGLLFNLRAEGYTAQLAVDGETALEAIAADPVDAIILDVMLPGRDGFSVAAELRAQQNFVPILMLTARGRPEDVLNGFSAGADDYLSKPFDLAILLARLNGLLRRMGWLRPEPAASPAQPSRAPGLPATFSFAGRTIHFAALELTTPDKTIRLTLM